MLKPSLKPVFTDCILDTNKTPLTTCRPKRARILLKQGKASVFHKFPFTIILKYEIKEVSPRPKFNFWKSIVQGFQTGDMVKAVVTKGKKTGVYIGRIVERVSGYFNIAANNGVVQGISYKSCLKLYMCDGYNYITS